MKPFAPLIIVGVIALFLLAAGFLLFDIETVHGNQIGVLETWSEGVVDEPKYPKTYVLFPGFMKKIFTYDVSSQIFVMNDQDANIEFGEGRRRDSYRVQSAEGQDMGISLSVRWRINPDKIVEIHKTIRDSIEEKVLRPEIMRTVKDQATLRMAIDAYSGAGLVQLQTDIEAALADPDSELSQRGVVVENFVIENIQLDPEYIGEIKARQVAMQRELRAKEEEKAALAEAQKANAVAQAGLEKSVVEGERDKRVGILEAEKEAAQEVLAAGAAAEKVVLAAEASKRRVVLAAEGDKQQVVLAAEGEMEAGQLKAQAILVIGESEAEATRLRLSAYSAAGPEAFVQIEVSRNMAEAFKNINGYLPQDMKINLLSESFMDAVQQVVGPKQAP